MAVNHDLYLKLFVYLSQWLAWRHLKLKYFDSLDQQTSVVNQANGIITKAISEVFPDLVDENYLSNYLVLVYFWTKKQTRVFRIASIFERNIYYWMKK